jgi:hypothetical protein
MGPVAQLAIALQHEPAGAEQRVAEHQADPGQDRKWVQPAKRAAGVLAVGDRNTPDHGADRGPLCERDHDRAKEEPPVPDWAHPLAAVTELKGDGLEPSCCRLDPDDGDNKETE